MPAMQVAPIRYSAGNEHNPGDPFGRTELQLAPDGAARLEQVTRAGRRAWIGQVRAAALTQLWSDLAASGFPAVPPHALVAGATLRRLQVGDATIQVEWYAVARWPALAAVFAQLDAMVRQLSQGAVATVAAGGPQLVDAVAPA